MLRALFVRNFQALDRLQLGLSEAAFDASDAGEPAAALQGINVLIGRNSTGKSSVFEALAFIRDVLLHDLPYASAGEGRGGFARLRNRDADERDPMIFRMLFEMPEPRCRLSYELQFDFDAHRRPYIAAENLSRLIEEKESADKDIKGLALATDKEIVGTPLAAGAEHGFGKVSRKETILDCKEGRGEIFSEAFGRNSFQLLNSKQPALALFGRMLQYRELCWLYLQISHWYFCRIPEQISETRRGSEKGGHKHLNERCDNVANVLRYLEKEEPARYRQLMERIDAKIPGIKRMGDSVLDAGISSGNLKLFIILLLLEDPRPLICLDEPDLGLYHEMVEAMLLDMRDYSLRHPRSQLLLSTHNPVLLDGLRPEEVWAMERSESGDGLSARAISRDPLVLKMCEEGVGLGSLWYGGHLGLR